MHRALTQIRKIKMNKEKEVVLFDGSTINRSFYDAIAAVVKSRYDHLNIEEDQRIDDILGAAFLRTLNESDSKKAFKAFIRMVENFEVPYLEVQTPSKHYTYYELMPTMPSLVDELPF